MLDDARQRHAEAFDPVERQPRIGDAAANAVLDEIGDHVRRLPVDAHRLRQLGQHVALKIGHHMHDAGRRDLDADDTRGVGIELQKHPRAAARRVADGAHLARHDQPVIEQRSSDRRDGGGAEFRPFADLHARDRPMPTDRVHHVEAIDRAHEFRVGRLHPSGFRAPQLARVLLRAGDLFLHHGSQVSMPRRPNKPLARDCRLTRAAAEQRFNLHHEIMPALDAGEDLSREEYYDAHESACRRGPCLGLQHCARRSPTT